MSHLCSVIQLDRFNVDYMLDVSKHLPWTLAPAHVNACHYRMFAACREFMSTAAAPFSSSEPMLDTFAAYNGNLA